MAPSNLPAPAIVDDFAGMMFSATSHRFLRVAILCISFGCLAFMLVVLGLAPEQHARLVGPGFLLVQCLVAWLLIGQGRIRATVLLLVIGSWILATGICVFNGGVRTPVVVAYPPLIIMAGWLLGRRTATVLTAMTLMATLGFVIADARGLLPAQPPTPAAMFWAVQATAIAGSGALIVFLLRNYRHRIAEVRELSGNLARFETDAAAAESARRSNYLLDKTGHMAKVGGWELDLASGSMNWTTQVFRIHELEPGVAPSLDQAIGYFAPELRATMETAARDAIAHGRIFDLELPLVTEKGRPIWVRMMGEPHLADGKVVRLSGTIQDITEQRHAALALTTSVENLQRTLEAIGEGIFAYDGRDPSGRLLFANDEVFRIWGIPLEDAPHTGRAEIIAAARKLFVEPDAEVGRIGEILASASPHEDRVHLNDGRVLLRRSAPILGGDGVSRVWTFRDITREERALADLREREEQLRHAQEIARMGSFDWNLVSGELRWSDQHFRLWGLKPGEVTPDYALFRAGVHPDDAAQLEEILQAALAGGRHYECSHRVVWPDGTIRYIKGLGEVMFDADGRAVHMLGTVRDISERVAAESALIAARDDADRAKLAADAANAAKSEFLSNMSHEIRTPLNAVLGLAQVGQRETVGTPVRRLFDQMLESGQHLLGIINNVLDFSKIEAGKLAIEMEAVRIQELVDRAMGFCAARASEKGLQLRMELGSDVPQAVMADFLRVSQVLSNLLDNAIKFTAQGEVVLGVERVGDRLRFRVRDTGVGMSDEQMQRIFQPFEQADGSTTRRFGGTGLGLVICKRLVEIMGGSIRVESRLGGGSVFEVLLPLMEAASAATQVRARNLPSEAAGAQEGRRLVGMRILVAEDNPVNQLVLRELLEHEGAELVCVHDGLAALESIARRGAESFDIVLTDIQMPNMDGHQLAQRLRETCPTLPVVGLTAHAFVEERQRCFASGMVEHVTKPVELDPLVEVLRKHARRPAVGVADRADLSMQPDTAAKGHVVVDWDALLAQYRGNQTLVAKMVQVALASEGSSVARLRDAAGRSDLDAIAFVAHRIKGMSANFGAEVVRAFAGETELAARAGEPAAATRALRLADLMDEFLRVLAGPRSERARQDPHPSRAG